MKIITRVTAILIALFTVSTVFGQSTGTITGKVVDEQGAVMIGVTVVVKRTGGEEKTVVTNNNGLFRVNSLQAGTYEVRANSPGFAEFSSSGIIVGIGKTVDVPILLVVGGINESVDVVADEQVSTSSEDNKSQLVLKEDDLESLPDDPDELEQALQALAGGAAGPNGGQIYIDGFEGGDIPDKDTIREIRINRNPFSAEFDRLGFGRIEILTKPGTNRFRGRAFLNYNDDAFNSRNPFATNKADSMRRFFGGNVSGPVIKNKASFFLNINKRDSDNGTIVNANVIDDGFNVVPFQQEFTVPNRRFSINPRFDYQINENNTLILRYDFNRSTGENQGLGGFTLPTRAIESERTAHTFQLTETAILNSKTVNETRFQFRRTNSERQGISTEPAINVLGAFNGGGATTGFNFDRNTNFEIQNYTTTALGKSSEHAVKFGVRVRGSKLDDRSESNYNGTFTFSGFVDDNGTPGDTSDDFLVSSAEQYRQALLGNPDPRFNPSQFTIAAGNPEASITQYDVGAFITDDWRLNEKLTLGFGLRYENQTNISDSLNFAPRLNFAWAPAAGGDNPAKTVIRGGLGVFYSRFGANTVLTAERLDGTRQQQFIVTGSDPILDQPVFTLNGVTNVPTAAQLGGSSLSNTPWILANDLQAPYTIQGAVSWERSFPKNTNISVYYVRSRNLHLIRNRNINAPVCPPGSLCPTEDPVALQALRPDPNLGNVYLFESSGVQDQQQLIVGFRSFYSRAVSIFGSYRISDVDGNGTGFPSYSFDTDLDFASEASQRRQFFFMGSSFRLPWQEIRISPFVIAGSGSPFNITTGRDNNGDSIFNDRPTFGELASACLARGITADWCNVAGEDPNSIIPRNFGIGPAFTTINLSINKNIGFGGSASRDQGNNSSGRRRGGRGGNVFGGGRGRGGFGRGDRKPYNLSLGLSFRNLLNTNNEGNPVGSISSPLFGESTSTIGGFGRGGSSGGNRFIEMRVRFSF